jgi:S1-C subfamily serine protease
MASTLAALATGFALSHFAPWSRPAAAPFTPSEVVEVERTQGVGAELAGAMPIPTQSSLPSRSPSPTLAPRDIARRALAVTVFVRTPQAYGAGVVLDAAGHVLTCDHVVSGLSEAGVHFADSTSAVTARVIDRDRKLDLALLATGVARTAFAEPGSVAHAEPGDEVFAMGAPRKMRFSLGRGIVAFSGRAFDGLFYLQTDLATNAGSSGGPVLDASGRLIAISSFVVRNGDGLSFALPIDYAYQRFSGALAPKGDSARFSAWLAAKAGGVPASGQHLSVQRAATSAAAER